MQFIFVALKLALLLPFAFVSYAAPVAHDGGIEANNLLQNVGVAIPINAPIVLKRDIVADSGVVSNAKELITTVVAGADAHITRNLGPVAGTTDAVVTAALALVKGGGLSAKRQDDQAIDLLVA